MKNQIRTNLDDLRKWLQKKNCPIEIMLLLEALIMVFISMGTATLFAYIWTFLGVPTSKFITNWIFSFILVFIMDLIDKEMFRP